MTHPMMNNYFTQEAKELFNAIVEESINFAGINCYYIPRIVDAEDLVLNEIFLSKYKEAFSVTVLREEVGGFFPNDFFVQKFGAEYSGDSTTFAISKTHFQAIVNDVYPQQGAMLVFPETSQIYEIKDVDTRDPWTSGGKNYYWKMQCRPFERGHTQKIYKDVFDYLDSETEDLIEEMMDKTDVYDPHFFTADSTCVFASTTKHLASEDLMDDYFLPVTADREDVWASEEDWFVDIEWKQINIGDGPKRIVPLKYPDAKNGIFGDEANKYLVSTPYGFN